jgi:hypothetical protein
MIIRSSFRGLLIWFGVAAGLALVGLVSVETDAACQEWGYVVKNSEYCEASAGYWLARFFGLNCLLAGISIIWAFIKQASRQRSGGSRPGSFVSASYGPSGERIRPTVPPPPPPPIENILAPNRETMEEPRELFSPGVVPQIESSPAVRGIEHAVTYERKERFAFRGLASIGKSDIDLAIEEIKGSFFFTQSTMTGLHLAELLKRGGGVASVHVLRGAEMFDYGTELGRILFGLPRTRDGSFGPFPGELMSGWLNPAKEDAEYFAELGDQHINELFESLPDQARQWFDTQIDAVSSSAAKMLLRRLFVCGIMYLGFQVPPMISDGTW